MVPGRPSRGFFTWVSTHSEQWSVLNKYMVVHAEYDDRYNMMGSCCTTCTGAVVWADDELFALAGKYTPTCGMEELRKLNAQEPAEIPAR